MIPRRMDPVDLDQYVRFEAEHVHPRIAGWVSPDVIRERLCAELSSEIEQRTELGDAERYRQRCAVQGVHCSEYMLREIDLGDDGRLLAGIHFLGMDVRLPFVGVLARTRALEGPAAIERVTRRLWREFARFQPQRWRVWPSSADSALELTPGTEVDMFVLAGRLDDLRARPVREVTTSVALDACDAGEIHAEYLATFERFFAAHPQWRGRIQIESEERLRQAQTLGVLARALVDGRSAGFFAAVPAAERALTGFVMLEEILDTPFRGRGLAPTLQRMLFDHLAQRGADPRAIVFGHIAHSNAASLRSAQAVGRQEVYRTVFLPFA